MGARLVGDDVGLEAEAPKLGQNVGGVGAEPDAQRPPLVLRRLRAARSPPRGRRRARRGTGCRAGAGSARGSTSMHSAAPPFIVTASGCAPPIPPSPAVTVTVPASVPRSADARSPRSTRRSPAGSPGCRCRSRSRRSSGRTSSGPRSSSRRNSSQFAQSGTRLELAMRTRGAHSWVRNTPTGLPDWTSMRLVVAQRPRRARRSRRTRPRTAPRGRFPRRPRGRPAAPRPPGRGCSSASASPPPAASHGRRAHLRGARGRVAARPDHPRTSFAAPRWTGRLSPQRSW